MRGAPMLRLVKLLLLLGGVARGGAGPLVDRGAATSPPESSTYFLDAHNLEVELQKPQPPAPPDSPPDAPAVPGCLATVKLGSSSWQLLDASEHKCMRLAAEATRQFQTKAEGEQYMTALSCDSWDSDEGTVQASAFLGPQEAQALAATFLDTVRAQRLMDALDCGCSNYLTVSIHSCSALSAQDADDMQLHYVYNFTNVALSGCPHQCLVSVSLANGTRSGWSKDLCPSFADKVSNGFNISGQFTCAMGGGLSGGVPRSLNIEAVVTPDEATRFMQAFKLETNVALALMQPFNYDCREEVMTARVVSLDSTLPLTSCGDISMWSHTSSSCDPCTAPLPAPFFFVDLAGVGLGDGSSSLPGASDVLTGSSSSSAAQAEDESGRGTAQGGDDEAGETKALLERLQSPYAVTCFSGARVLTSLSVSVLSFSDRWVDVAKEFSTASDACCPGRHLQGVPPPPSVSGKTSNADRLQPGVATPPSTCFLHIWDLGNTFRITTDNNLRLVGEASWANLKAAGTGDAGVRVSPSRPIMRLGRELGPGFAVLRSDGQCRAGGMLGLPERRGAVRLTWDLPAPVSLPPRAPSPSQPQLPPATPPSAPPLLVSPASQQQSKAPSSDPSIYDVALASSLGATVVLLVGTVAALVWRMRKRRQRQREQEQQDKGSGSGAAGAEDKAAPLPPGVPANGPGRLRPPTPTSRDRRASRAQGSQDGSGGELGSYGELPGTKHQFSDLSRGGLRVQSLGRHSHSSSLTDGTHPLEHSHEAGARHSVHGVMSVRAPSARRAAAFTHSPGVSPARSTPSGTPGATPVAHAAVSTGFKSHWNQASKHNLAGGHMVAARTVQVEVTADTEGSGPGPVMYGHSAQHSVLGPGEQSRLSCSSGSGANGRVSSGETRLTTSLNKASDSTHSTQLTFSSNLGFPSSEAGSDQHLHVVRQGGHAAGGSWEVRMPCSPLACTPRSNDASARQASAVPLHQRHHQPYSLCHPPATSIGMLASSALHCQHGPGRGQMSIPQPSRVQADMAHLRRKSASMPSVGESPLPLARPGAHADESQPSTISPLDAGLFNAYAAYAAVIVQEVADSTTSDLGDAQAQEPGFSLARSSSVRSDVDLEVDLNQITFLTGSLLGFGAVGSVYKALYKGFPVAVKILTGSYDGQLQGSEEDGQSLLQEVHILSRLNHPHIVNLYGGCVRPPRIFIIEELMAGTLSRLIHSPTEDLPLSRALDIALGIARGLQYLHGRNPPVLHRDLKPANVLLDAEGCAKIADFGLARRKNKTYLQTRQYEAGTVAYTAPECFNPDLGGVSTSSDVFGFAVILWQLVTREHPWEGLPSTAIIYRVAVQGARMALPSDAAVCPQRLAALISACWDMQPHARPTAAQIVDELCVVRQQLLPPL